MRTVRLIAAIPAAILLFAACSDNDTADSTTTVSSTPATDASTSNSGTGSTSGDASSDSAVDGPVQIDVLVGTDSSPDRVEHVKLGESVTLNITNPAAADSYHVHGYDYEQDVAKGVTATINFTADTAGTFEVESHITEDVLVVIEVK